ncbi:MAG: hypothetical protein IAF38_16195, partial [Bacteroidia bacterium]|nr:hypothetical protein [Bacteroidia bacterium]
MKKITTLFTALLLVSAVTVSKAQSTCSWAKKASGTNEEWPSSMATDAAG